MKIQPGRWGAILLGIAGIVGGLGPRAEAQWGARRRVVVGRAATRTVQRPTPRGLEATPMLGSFYPTPYMTVGGSGVIGSAGYTPMHAYGDGTLSLYGPISPLRATSAPVLTVTRGYNGVARPMVGTSFSYPYLPTASPVVYPTRGNVVPGFRVQNTPPYLDSGFNWVDYQ